MIKIATKEFKDEGVVTLRDLLKKPPRFSKYRYYYKLFDPSSFTYVKQGKIVSSKSKIRVPKDLNLDIFKEVRTADPASTQLVIPVNKPAFVKATKNHIQDMLDLMTQKKPTPPSSSPSITPDRDIRGWEHMLYGWDENPVLKNEKTAGALGATGCECGTHATYGASYPKDMHSAYCPIYKESLSAAKKS